jgi:hypothetical protein
MSLVGETPERKITATALKTSRYLNRAHALLEAEEVRFLTERLSGKVTLELFYRQGALIEPPQVAAKVACEA